MPDGVWHELQGASGPKAWLFCYSCLIGSLSNWKGLSALLLSPHLEPCSYVIGKNWGHPAHTSSVSLPSTFPRSSASILTGLLSSLRGWLCPSSHSFIWDLRPQDNTKFPWIVNSFLSTYCPSFLSSGAAIFLFLSLYNCCPRPWSSFKLLPSLSWPKFFHKESTHTNSVPWPPYHRAASGLRQHHFPLSDPSKDKGFVLVFGCMDPYTAGDTADPLFSLGTPPSPSITSLPFGFLPIFLIIIPESSSWPTQSLPVLPGGVCPDSAHCLAVVLRLSTSLEQSHLPRTGYIICEA